MPRQTCRWAHIAALRAVLQAVLHAVLRRAQRLVLSPTLNPVPGACLVRLMPALLIAWSGLLAALPDSVRAQGAEPATVSSGRVITYRSDGDTRITTWNLQHMMSEVIFDRWVSFCSRHGWREDQVKAAGVRKPSDLTYCNAHDGLLYPSDVQESLPLHDKAAFAGKLAALIRRREELDSEIFALQEVSDEAGVRRIFPAAAWHVIASKAAIAQNIAFAVRRNSGLKVVSSRQIDALGVTDDSGHQARPGLEMTVERGGRRLTLLNIHLKASCRSQALSAPSRPAYANDARWAEIQQGCKVLRKQVPALEHWVEAQTHAGAWFMIVGDWNRDLRRDLSMPARLNEEDDAKAPIKPGTRIGSLIKEISDNDPPGAWLAIARTKVLARKKTVRAPDQQKPDSVCHEGIDNFALSASLMQSLQLKKGDLLAWGNDYGEYAYGVAKAMPSDHCPVTLSLRF